MEIKWNNIIGFVLLILLVVIVLNSGTEIGTVMDGLRGVGRGRSSSVDEPFYALLIFGMIGAIIVAIVKILTQDR